MTRHELLQIVHSRVDEWLDRLEAKNAKYSPGADDALSNFRNVAQDDNVTMAEALWGFVRKHVEHVRKMCKSTDSYPMDEWVENCGDIGVYMLLLEAIVTEAKRGKGTGA